MTKEERPLQRSFFFNMENPDINTHWIAQEILELLNERRKAKNNITAYKKLDREVRNTCQKAKEILLNNQGQEIEELEKKNPQLMHAKIKEATRK